MKLFSISGKERSKALEKQKRKTKTNRQKKKKNRKNAKIGKEIII